MTDKTSTEREALLKVCSLVRPALHAQDYVPALQTICFDGKHATAFNDKAAISIRFEAEIQRCIPGEFLIRALSSFGAKEVSFTEGKDGAVKLSSGRSNVKVPTLALDAFPLQWPEKDGKELDLDASILKGIARCLLNVSGDPTHVEAMGVTLDTVDGRAVLYSTDSFTISRYTTDTKLKLPGDAPVVLPTFFCEQLLALSRHFDKEEVLLIIRADSLEAQFGKSARLFTKTLMDTEALDFPGKLKALLKVDNLKKELVDIPDSFDSALQRALLVLQGEQDKSTAINLKDSSFVMSSSSPMGDADDMLKFDGDIDFGAPTELCIDPSLVARGAKACALMGFMPRALVMCDAEAQFVHVVAYVVQKKQ